MTVLLGKIKLLKLIDTLTNHFENSYEFKSTNKFILEETTNKEFIVKELIKVPFIVYVKKNQLPANTQIDNIEPFLKKIIGVEKILNIVFLRNILTHSELEELEVDCILIENENKNLQTLDSISDLIFIDYFLLRNNNTHSQRGKIDFKKLEKRALINFGEDILNIFKKKSKYVFQSLLRLNLLQSKKFEFSESYVDFNDIDISKYKHTYEVCCFICNKKYEINLNNDTDLHKYIYFKNNGKTTRVYFKCEHDHDDNLPKIDFFNSLSEEIEVDNSTNSLKKGLIYLYTNNTLKNNIFKYHNPEKKTLGNMSKTKLLDLLSSNSLQTK